jgi:hypothetical protein
MVDWDGHLLRTEEDCCEILAKAGIPSTSLAFQRDKSEVIMFFTATKCSGRSAYPLISGYLFPPDGANLLPKMI